jgi:hypothetical protein
VEHLNAISALWNKPQPMNLLGTSSPINLHRKRNLLSPALSSTSVWRRGG